MGQQPREATGSRRSGQVPLSAASARSRGSSASAAMSSGASLGSPSARNPHRAEAVFFDCPVGTGWDFEHAPEQIEASTTECVAGAGSLRVAQLWVRLNSDIGPLLDYSLAYSTIS